jgi:hypothetical protein
LPFIWALTALTVSYEAIRLVTRKSTLALIAYDGLIKILNFTLALFMFSDRAIWNPNFMTEMVQSGLTTAGSEGYQTVSLMWNQFTGYFIYFIGVVFAIEMITTAVRAFRMRNPAWKGQTSHPAAD